MECFFREMIPYSQSLDRLVSQPTTWNPFLGWQQTPKQEGFATQVHSGKIQLCAVINKV